MMKGVTAFLLLALASYGVDAQEPQEAQLVEVFQESDAIPSPDEASGRSFGMFQNFDALTYKENLLHNKISFLFSLVPRPNVAHWNRPPYPGGLGPYPMQPGGFPPGYPAQLSQTGPLRPPPFGGGGIIPSQGFYPGAGFNNPYYPSIVPGYPAMPPGLYPPGILPVVSENNITNASGGSGVGNKPSASAAVAAPAPSTAAPTTTTAAESGADESVAAAAEEEETKRHTIIKMMPKSFHMN